MGVKGGQQHLSQGWSGVGPEATCPVAAARTCVLVRPTRDEGVCPPPHQPFPRGKPKPRVGPRSGPHWAPGSAPARSRPPPEPPHTYRGPACFRSVFRAARASSALPDAGTRCPGNRRQGNQSGRVRLRGPGEPLKDCVDAAAGPGRPTKLRPRAGRKTPTRP